MYSIDSDIKWFFIAMMDNAASFDGGESNLDESIVLRNWSQSNS